MKQTFVRIAAATAFAGIALAAGSAAWAHADGGCMGAQSGATPKAEEQHRGPHGQGMRGMGMMMGQQSAMAERMARMHGDGAARPGQQGQPGAAMPCRDGGTAACPFQEEHKH